MGSLRAYFNLAFVVHDVRGKQTWAMQVEPVGWNPNSRPNGWSGSGCSRWCDADRSTLRRPHRYLLSRSRFRDKLITSFTIIKVQNEGKGFNFPSRGSANICL